MFLNFLYPLLSLRFQSLKLFLWTLVYWHNYQYVILIVFLIHKSNKDEQPVRSIYERCSYIEFTSVHSKLYTCMRVLVIGLHMQLYQWMHYPDSYGHIYILFVN